MAKLTVKKNQNQQEIAGGLSKGELLQKIQELQHSDHEAKLIPIGEIETGLPFSEIFPIKEEVQESITQSMKKDGFDKTHPLLVWKEKGILIDGNTRKKCAALAGIKEVPVLYISLSDEQTALDYAYAIQFRRRNMDDADRFSFATSYLNNVVQNKGKNGWKKQKLADVLQVSLGAAQKYITVINNSSDEQKKMVLEGLATINQLYSQLKKPAVKSEKPDQALPEPDGSGKERKPRDSDPIPILKIIETEVLQVVERWKELLSKKPEYFIQRLEALRQILPEKSQVLIRVKEELENAGGYDDSL